MAPLQTPRRRFALPAVGSQLFLVLLTLGFLAPVAWAVLSAFKPAIDIIRYPLVFDPTRFTGGPRPEPSHRYAWMPFGGGPRACIGQHFSMVEAVLALALVLREHRVTARADTDRLPVGSLITLFPTEPVLARVERLA